MKYWKIAFYILGVIPLGFIISLLVFYFRVGLILGRLPFPSYDDPKNFDIYTIYSDFIYLSSSLWIISLFAWFIIVGIYSIIHRKQIKWTPVLISLISQIIAILLAFSRIFEWFLD